MLVLLYYYSLSGRTQQHHHHHHHHHHLKWQGIPLLAGKSIKKKHFKKLIKKKKIKLKQQTNEQTNRQCRNDRRSESVECDFIADQSQDDGCKPKTRVMSLTSFIKVAVTRHKKQTNKKQRNKNKTTKGEKRKEKKKSPLRIIFLLFLLQEFLARFPPT